MYRTAVEYPQGSKNWLAPGSDALEMYLEWQKSKKPADKQKLDAHCARLDREFLKLEGRS